MKAMHLLFGGMLLLAAACGPGRGAADRTKAARTTSDSTFTVRGELVMGHEVRSFTPECGTTQYWVEDSTGQLAGAYGKYADTLPYSPVFAVLKVRDMGRADDGFAAEYAGVYQVVEIVSVDSLK